MRGYEASSYGDGFADVYDEWYSDLCDPADVVALVLDLAVPTASLLELGVGTGRLAVPLARAGLRVTGIDTSTAMLDRLAQRDVERTVTAMRGDMVDDLPDGPFDVVLAAYNTVFNLLDEDRQAACFRRVAERLSPHGCFVVEAEAPHVDSDGGSQVTVRTMTADHVVLSASVHDPSRQRAEGQFIEISQAGGVRLRPWAVRYASPEQLDAFASGAGLRVAARWADVARTPFDPARGHHVSVYGKVA